jgi:hypothetical protein
MRAEEKQAAKETVETISESEFQRVCDGVYRDRREIYQFNPGAGHSEAVLWMLLGCLISLLSVTDEELQTIAASSTGETYGDVIRELLSKRAAPPFDPRPFLDELSRKVESE